MDVSVAFVLIKKLEFFLDFISQIVNRSCSNRVAIVQQSCSNPAEILFSRIVKSIKHFEGKSEGNQY